MTRHDEKKHKLPSQLISVAQTPLHEEIEDMTSKENKVGGNVGLFGRLIKKIQKLQKYKNHYKVNINI